MEFHLFNAIIFGRIGTVRSLVHDRNVNIKNYEGNTLLHVAVLSQQERIVKILLKAKARVNERNNWCETPLQLAFKCNVRKKKFSIIRMLIMAGAEVNTKSNDAFRQSVIHIAAGLGNVNLVKLLIKRGADVNVQDKVLKWSPLHYAAANVRSEDPTIFEVLLAANADVNSLNLKNATPLHILCSGYATKSLSICRIVEVFMKYGADVHALDDCGAAPMDNAIICRHTEACKALVLFGGVDVNELDEESTNRCTFLHEALAIPSDLPTVKFLLKMGAKINALNTYNKSPLKELIHPPLGENYDWKEEYEIKQRIDLLKYMLKWNADVNTITNEKENILISNGRLLPVRLWQIILEHLAKLRAIEKPIHESLLATISENLECQTYFEKCYQELEHAKFSKLHSNCRITVLDILMASKRELVHYAGNPDILKYFTKNEIFIKKYPIFGTIIQDKLMKAIKRRKIWDRAAINMCTSNLFLTGESGNPKHLVILKIFSYLNFKELQKLC